LPGETGPGTQWTTHLPSLSSVTGQQPQRYSAPPPQPSEPSPPGANHWPSLNPLTAYYTPSHVQSAESPQKMDIDAAAPGSGSGAVGPASPDRYYDGRAGSVSLDDPDVRLAAEALGDLRAEGATSAYNNSKNFSPRFKSSAEYVEGYLTPIANTVGSVGRVTGVEGSVRWFLGGGRRHKSSSDLEAGDGVSNKRRKVAASNKTAPQDTTDRTPGSEQDVYGFTKDRRTSMSTVDTLPAYDELRSPAYSESAEAQGQLTSRPTSSGSAAWQQRLIMSTSGLSIAMSEESLRSLKYCLQWLRWANEHIAKVIATLKTTLEQYEKPGSEDELMHGVEQNGSVEGGGVENRSEVAARINLLKIEVLKTLRDVIDTVSKYAGGALPENARELVKRHLTSLPQRFRIATMQDSSAQVQGQDEEAKEKEIKEGAQKVLVLAKEGLDMMAQVSGVLDGTIVSAEEWCERLGRKKREERDSLRA
ncbi:Opi1-domain-containing protein, partial [Thozetella sp. PMI_491]